MQSGSLAIGTICALAGTMLGQVDSVAQAQQTAEKPTETQPFAPQAEATPRRTANDLLKALRRSKPIREPLSPTGSTHADPTPQKRLLPEGAAVIEWEGTLTTDGPWWVITPESPEDEPPTKVLPNINLEVITRSIAGKAGPVRFSVSGEMTAFQGENFLLIRFLKRLSVIAGPTAADTSSAKNAAKPLRPNDPDGRPRSAEDVISLIQGQEPRSVVPASKSPRTGPRMADLPSSSVRPDGSAFAQRPGRLTHDDRWWRFVFETDHSEQGAPTIKLLPGRGLELMIQSAKETRDGLVLLVSGELTQFRGQNYLLPRSVIRRTGTDNLRR